MLRDICNVIEHSAPWVEPFGPVRGRGALARKVFFHPAMIVIAFALLVGALLVALGAGGSIVAMPVLVYGAGLDAHQGAATSLLVVALVALAGLAAKWRRVQVQRGLVLGAAGIVGAVPGAWLNHAVPGTLVLLGFAATALLAARQMVRRREPRRAGAAPGARFGVILLAGLGLGVATGFFGVGGGFLIVPVLMLLGLEMDEATATSLLVIGLNSTSGLIAHTGFGAVEWRLGASFAATAIVGGLIALPLAHRLEGLRLQRAFAAVLGVAGVGILIQSLGQWLARA